MLPEAQQLVVLKSELFRALEATARLQRQSRAVDRDVVRLRTQAIVRAHQNYVRRADLEHELMQTRRDLARCKAEGEEQERSLRLEVIFAWRVVAASLDEACRALLLTIEHAALADALEAAMSAEASA